MRSPLLAVLLAVPLPLHAGVARDLGPMPLSGQMVIEWVALEDDGKGGFVGTWRGRGGTDGADGEEALLGGFDLACRGTMAVRDGSVLSDEAACRASDRHGNAVWLDLAAEAGPWHGHRIAVRAGDGTGLYARLSGTGRLTRMMHIAPTSAAPWGFFAGSIAWRWR